MFANNVNEQQQQQQLIPTPVANYWQDRTETAERELRQVLRTIRREQERIDAEALVVIGIMMPHLRGGGWGIGS